MTDINVLFKTKYSFKEKIFSKIINTEINVLIINSFFKKKSYFCYTYYLIFICPKKTKKLEIDKFRNYKT